MVVHAYYPVGETRVQRQATALVERGFAVDVIALRAPGEAARERLEGVDIIRLPVRRHRTRGLIAQLFEYLAFFALVCVRLPFRQRSRRYQTIQVHNLPDFLVFSAAIARAMGARVILDLHDLMPELFASRSNAGMSGLQVRLLLIQERLACAFADHVITVTDVWRERLVERGVPASKISVVMNVADPAIFQRGESELAVRVGGGFRLLYHGTFTHRYGVDVLVQAVAKARTEVDGVELRLLGDGETRSELAELVDELALNDVVTFSDGMIDAAELPAEIRWADAGVVPNRRDVFTDDILPTKLLELVATGTPAIVARTSGTLEYFDDTMAAYFDPGDVDSLARIIGELARDPARRTLLAQHADTFNRTHNWTAGGAAYADLIVQLGGSR